MTHPPDTLHAPWSPRLLRVHEISATLELLTPLHVGSGERDFGLRSVDAFTAKRRDTGLPLLPGSTLKGAMRTGLELELGLAGADGGRPLSLRGAQRLGWPAQAVGLLQLFGAQPLPQPGGLLSTGPARARFWDALPTEAWLVQQQQRQLPLTERIDQVQIDRGSGQIRRRESLEVVPAGARFDFRLTWMAYEGDEDGEALLFHGLQVLERRGVGRGNSRGMGRLRVDALCLDGQPWQPAPEDQP